jgi:hypothetical protein
MDVTSAQVPILQPQFTVESSITKKTGFQVSSQAGSTVLFIRGLIKRTATVEDNLKL